MVSYIIDSNKGEGYSVLGILVCILAFFHVPAVMELMDIPIYQTPVRYLYYLREFCLNSIYLTSFVVLLGYMYNREYSSKQAFVICVKRLLWPCLIIGFFIELIQCQTLDFEFLKNYVTTYMFLGQGNFYVVYLIFWTSLILVFSRKYFQNLYVRICVLLFFSLLSCKLLNSSMAKCNFLFLLQAFVMCPFLEVGNIFARIKGKNIVLSLTAIYFLCCLVLSCFGYGVPFIHDSASLSYKFWLPYMIIGSMGSFILAFYCSKIKSKLLRIIGENYVSFLLLHIAILSVMVNLTKSLIIKYLNNLLITLLFIVGLFILALSINYVLAIALKNKYLNWLLGGNV